MDVILINNKTKEAIHCCASEASRILGLKSRSTIYNWSKRKWRKLIKNTDYEIIFNSKVIKKKKRGKIK